MDVPSSAPQMEQSSRNETAIGDDLARRIRDFYQVSDDPRLNDTWANFFTVDAKVKIGHLEASGDEGT